MVVHRSINRFTDSITRVMGFLAVVSIWSLIGIFFGYILYQGMSAVFHYGFSSLFLSTDFQVTDNKVSFWAPFGVTVFLAVVTVIITIPVALRCSIWISFYCPSRFRKALDTFLLILANLPSVILAFYVRSILAPVVYKVFFLRNSLNLMVASVALVCMILPLIIVLFNAALEQHKTMIISGELLGIGKNYAIHKVIVPKIKYTIIIAITFIVGRALSESIMLSMLLSSENYKQGYEQGFLGFVNSQLNSIAPLIGENYFSDGSSPQIQNLMFLFGGLLLLSTLIFSSVLLEWMRRDSKRIRNTSRNSFRKRVLGRISWRFNKWVCGKCIEWESGVCSTAQFIYDSNIRIFRKASLFIRRFFEYFCLGLFVLYSCSFLGFVLLGGFDALFSTSESSYVGNDTLSRAICNTFMIVFLSVAAALPIALFSSLYLSEYAKNGRFKKHTLALINAASATPSIIFGIFGLFVFIQKLGWTASGSSGKSLLAGILTMVLFILPYLTNLFYTHISNVHHTYREAAYILGISKSKTFWSIVAPITFNNLVFSVLLTTGKIIGETAPLYLTAGINSSPGTLFMYQGQTLTTRIYAQLYESNVTKSLRIINESTFYCLLFIVVVVIMAKYANNLFKKEFWIDLWEKCKYAIS